MDPMNVIKSRRRGFMAAVGGGVMGMALIRDAQAVTVGPLNAIARRNRAFDLRVAQATANRNAAATTEQATNGDEETHANKIGNYTKGLPHNSLGEVDINAYNSLLFALQTGDPNAFEAIPLGGPRRLVNPQGGLAFEMEGRDGANFRIAPPPAFRSREMAAEMSECYWMALLRDVPFSQYPSNAIANAAAADLTVYGSDARVRKTAGGQVTPQLLFRGLAPGEDVGPYLSQFFYKPALFGVHEVTQRMRSPLPGVNFMTTFPSFLAVQNGSNPPPLAVESTLRYLRNGRQIGEYVHLDVLFQAYFTAFLALTAMGAPLDPGNPYAASTRQEGFGTFGGPHIATLLCEVSTRALHATWYQKWFAHRRVRPEAFAGAVHVRANMSGNQDRFPVHQELLNSLNSSSRLGGFMPSGNALLPMAFPEGSPTHPAYTAGHATVAGACVTVLKAFFDESWAIPNPVQPSDDGLSLLPYSGQLTVGGELNKMASNVGLGRNIAGVHWRSDGTDSFRLGEEIAIQIMREHNTTFNEGVGQLSLTRFDGTTTTI